MEHDETTHDSSRFSQRRLSFNRGEKGRSLMFHSGIYGKVGKDWFPFRWVVGRCYALALNIARVVRARFATGAAPEPQGKPFVRRINVDEFALLYWQFLMIEIQSSRTLGSLASDVEVAVHAVLLE